MTVRGQLNFVCVMRGGQSDRTGQIASVCATVNAQIFLSSELGLLESVVVKSVGRSLCHRIKVRFGSGHLCP